MQSSRSNRSASTRVVPTSGRFAALIHLNAIIPLGVDGDRSLSTTPVAARHRSSTPMVVRVLRPARHGSDSNTTLRASTQVCPTDRRHAARRLLDSNVWLRAFQTLRIVLGNTLVCIACTWLITWCYSRGNIVSLKPAVAQSDAEFVAGTVIVAHIVFFALLLLLQLPVLQRLSLAGVPKTASPLHIVLVCLQRLIQYTHRVFVLSLAITVGMVVYLQPQSIGGGVNVGMSYIFIYSVASHLNNTAMTLAVRRIYVDDTITGHRKRVRQQQQPQLQQQQPQQSSRSNSKRRTDRSSLYHTTRQFAKVFVQTSPKAITVMLAALYIQAINGYHIAGMLDFVAFTLGSLVLKNVVNSIAKRGVTKWNVNDPRTIFVAIGQPTVLIDTQVRIALQRVPSDGSSHTSAATYTIMWTLAMAVLELVLRWRKVVVTNAQVERKQQQMDAASHRHAPVSTITEGRTAGRTRSSAQSFAAWRHQIRTFQIAESYANMSAEYIAIGCSTCVLYFYWDHPKYMLGGTSTTDTTATTRSDTRDAHITSSTSALELVPWRHTSALGIQVLVEIVVDYVACAMEIHAGVDFAQLRRYRVFLALLFVVLATVNVQLCAMMYLNIS